jgi:DNA-binding response OmpR family regulator
MNAPRELRPEGSMAARVLIIEDEPLIAENLRATLIEAGFEIAGVAARIEKALRLIENEGCDVAIVDANLAGVSAGPAAAALSKREVPFIVLSGYTPGQLQPEFSRGLFIQKPCGIAELIDGLNAMLLKR